MGELNVERVLKKRKRKNHALPGTLYTKVSAANATSQGAGRSLTEMGYRRGESRQAYMLARRPDQFQKEQENIGKMLWEGKRKATCWNTKQQSTEMT